MDNLGTVRRFIKGVEETKAEEIVCEYLGLKEMKSYIVIH